MAIKHTKTAIPDVDKVDCTDWNADHDIEKVDSLPETADEAEVVYLNTDEHLYLNQTEG